MSWTYSGDPSHSSRDAVRYLVGDTDLHDQLISDQEIEYTISKTGTNIYRSAAEVCDAIAASLAKKMDKSVGGLSANYTQRYDHYVDMAARMRMLAKTKSPGVAVMTQENSDAIFEKGMHDFPGLPFYDDTTSPD